MVVGLFDVFCWWFLNELLVGTVCRFNTSSSKSEVILLCLLGIDTVMMKD